MKRTTLKAILAALAITATLSGCGLSPKLGDVNFNLGVDGNGKPTIGVTGTLKFDAETKSANEEASDKTSALSAGKKRAEAQVSRQTTAPTPKRSARTVPVSSLLWMTEDTRRPYALRTHLQDLDIRAGQIHLESEPPDAGMEHLATVEGNVTMAAQRLVSHSDDGKAIAASPMFSRLSSPQSANRITRWTGKRSRAVCRMLYNVFVSATLPG